MIVRIHYFFKNVGKKEKLNTNVSSMRINLNSKKYKYVTKPDVAQVEV